MRYATEEDSNILLLRATKKHHFSPKDLNFPGIISFRADGGDPAGMRQHSRLGRAAASTSMVICRWQEHPSAS